MTKNLEKLAEIGERKLLEDLTMNLMEIKQSLAEDNFSTEHLTKKIKSYHKLITTCKNCGLDINEQEKIYAQIMDYTKEISEKKKILSELSVRTKYGNEMEEYL